MSIVRNIENQIRRVPVEGKDNSRRVRFELKAVQSSASPAVSYVTLKTTIAVPTSLAKHLTRRELISFLKYNGFIDQDLEIQSI